MSQAKVVNVRTGQHYCFDRLVIDLNGRVGGYTVRYVPQVTQDGCTATTSKTVTQSAAAKLFAAASPFAAAAPSTS